MITPKESHWKKIHISGPDSCWIWSGSKGPYGHGEVRVKGKNIRITRLILAWIEGIEIPNRDILALHSCDNPPCVNPMHLRWGSHTDNVNDALERKRYKNNFKIGQEHSHAKLTEEKVLTIRRKHDVDGIKKRALSNEYAVSFQTISHIVNRITWTHV